ncbi:PEP-CTERM sorting domain-containing protein [Akkermansiaceae bacterium]|jgi:hypothetical protein|nr:PEP-CTERM sorting domain-containing protein [Akkermansiaceae bacterium]
MIPYKRLLLLLPISLLSIGSHRAEGGIVIVTDRATWVGILDSGQVAALDDFTGATAYQDSDANEAVPRTATVPTPVSYEVKNTSRTAIFNNALSSASPQSSFTFDNFSRGISAIGFNSWIGENNASKTPVSDTGPIRISVNGNFELESPTVSTSTTDFFGIYDDTGASISSLQVSWVRGDASGAKFNYIDNLEFGDAAGVPEPSTAAMGLLAIVGFAGNRRRRRQVSAA